MPDDIPIDKRVVKEPTVTKAPPAGRKFPCPSCGGRLDFDPAVRGLACPYCGYQQKIAKLADAEVKEQDYEQYLFREEANGQQVEGRSTQTRCTGCGAVVLLEDKVATDRCPFCNTHLESKPEAAEKMIPPEGVLPFAIDLRNARDAFTTWLERLWFAPTELKQVVALGQLSGVYLPFWTYDSMTYTVYDGQRGDDYQDTQYVTQRLADGTTREVAQTVTRTEWSGVSGEVQHFFDDVLVCGSKSLPGDLIDDLGEWQLPKVTPFQPDYLSGFKTERYAVGLKDGFVVAQGMMEPTILNLIRRDIGGDHQRIDRKRTTHSAVTFKHLLLPAWVAVYRYHDRTFQVLVNGRTGKVTGYRPWSTSKIVALILLICVIVAFIMAAVMYFQR